jgi:hypothetical protein
MADLLGVIGLDAAAAAPLRDRVEKRLFQTRPGCEFQIVLKVAEVAGGAECDLPCERGTHIRVGDESPVQWVLVEIKRSVRARLLLLNKIMI